MQIENMQIDMTFEVKCTIDPRLLDLGIKINFKKKFVFKIALD